jgi:hypothetical protein
VRDLSADNFGPLIAYLLPGFVALWGMGSFMPSVEVWLAASPSAAPTVGGFLYITLGSVAVGMLVSAVRWAILDTLHHHTGIPQPPWDFSQFPAHMDAFDSLVQDHYRYYQHYGNMLVAVAFVYLSTTFGIRPLMTHEWWKDLGVLVVVLILYVGSRDALRKYYERTAVILCAPSGQRPLTALSSQAIPRSRVRLRSAVTKRSSSSIQGMRAGRRQ